MFDFSKIPKRYYVFILKNGRKLHIEPPKMKVLRKVWKLAKINPDDISSVDGSEMDDLIQAVVLILNKNTQNFKVTEDWVDDNMNLNEIQLFLFDFFNWVQGITNEKN